MFQLERIQESWKVRAPEVRYGAQSREQAPLRYLLEMSLADVLQLYRFNLHAADTPILYRATNDIVRHIWGTWSHKMNLQ